MWVHHNVLIVHINNTHRLRADSGRDSGSVLQACIIVVLYVELLRQAEGTLATCLVGVGPGVPPGVGARGGRRCDYQLLARHCVAHTVCGHTCIYIHMFDSVLVQRRLGVVSSGDSEAVVQFSGSEVIRVVALHDVVECCDVVFNVVKLLDAHVVVHTNPVIMRYLRQEQTDESTFVHGALRYGVEVVARQDVVHAREVDLVGPQRGVEETEVLCARHESGIVVEPDSGSHISVELGLGARLDHLDCVVLQLYVREVVELVVVQLGEARHNRVLHCLGDEGGNVELQEVTRLVLEHRDPELEDLPRRETCQLDVVDWRRGARVLDGFRALLGAFLLNHEQTLATLGGQCGRGVVQIGVSVVVNGGDTWIKDRNSTILLGKFHTGRSSLAISYSGQGGHERSHEHGGEHGRGHGDLHAHLGSASRQRWDGKWSNCWWSRWDQGTVSDGRFRQHGEYGRTFTNSSHGRTWHTWCNNVSFKSDHALDNTL